MVLTPRQRATSIRDASLSPLLLPSNPKDLLVESPAAGVPSTSHSSISTAQTSSSGQFNGNPVQTPPIRRFSSSSFSKLSEFNLDAPAPGSSYFPDVEGLHINGDDRDFIGARAGPSRQNSTNSSSGVENGVKGVRYVDLSLDPGEWRHPVFKQKVLSVLKRLKVPLWNEDDIRPHYVRIQKVSGALTNAVFFISFNPSINPTSPSMSPLLTPTLPPSDPDLPISPASYPPTLLLRIYGPSSDALISRIEELRILHVLSTQYGLGPKVYGTFLNGRIEQFFPSRALKAEELRDPIVSRGIARRMRELHSVDLKKLGYEDGKYEIPKVWECVEEWAPNAERVLLELAERSVKWKKWVEDFGLERLVKEIECYKAWVIKEGKTDVVFAHNDTQYGNLLILDQDLPKGVPPHHQYIVIDFEYASPNPRGYDIANHFHEWRANYHHPTLSHSLSPHFPYPSLEQRYDFYRAYLSIEIDALNGEEVIKKRKDVDIKRVERLEKEVKRWSPACSAFWALWGIIQAEEMVEKLKGLENEDEEKWEFDYLSYAMGRLEMFRSEAKELGIQLPES